MYQIDHTNLLHTDVILGPDRIVKLKELLPYPWNEAWDS